MSDPTSFTHGNSNPACALILRAKSCTPAHMSAHHTMSDPTSCTHGNSNPASPLSLRAKSCTTTIDMNTHQMCEKV